MSTPNHYDLVARALRWITDNQLEQPGLSELGAALNVSPHHLQRVFQDWAGVTPKQFLASLTRREALARLRAGNSVLESALSAGLSGPGRLHDLMVTTEALTPGEISKRGQNMTFFHGFGSSPFGEALVSWNDRGLNFLGFCQETGPGNALKELKFGLSRAEFREDASEAQSWLNRIFDRCENRPLPVWLRGSPFQLKVWEALLSIPEGMHGSYGSIACQIGSPGAARAVGSAIGSNPVSWLIPCHRVIRSLGEIGGYRWGSSTKQAMIGLEAARESASAL